MIKILLLCVILSSWAWAKEGESLSAREQEGLDFLTANMPDGDRLSLAKKFLVENVRLAYQAVDEVPWGHGIPKEIFLNDVLPYASLNERRDNWRADFHRRFLEIAKQSKTIDQAVLALNSYVFSNLHVAYSADKRPKPDQSPYESTQAHYASCTGLSILLTDALRAVGIPARIAAIAQWPDDSGNHTWVEIWDGQWHYVGAAEPGALDHAWFSAKAAKTDRTHPIYAISFRKTGLIFPMRWAPELKYVPAEDVTRRYAKI